MSALCMQVHPEFHTSRHHGIHADGNLTGLIIGVVMCADHRVEAVDQSGIGHRTRPLPEFFGRLEHQSNGPVDQLPMSRQPECRPQQ